MILSVDRKLQIIQSPQNFMHFIIGAGICIHTNILVPYKSHVNYRPSTFCLFFVYKVVNQKCQLLSRHNH